jgi:hypothetical protein
MTTEQLPIPREAIEVEVEHYDQQGNLGSNIVRADTDRSVGVVVSDAVVVLREEFTDGSMTEVMVPMTRVHSVTVLSKEVAPPPPLATVPRLVRQ